ncbi:hypothetical protein IJG14_05060 [bacterium]|nr:hypothetical protein [bacterium]
MGDFTISKGGVNYTSENKKGTITVGGSYTQSKDSSIYAKDIYAGSDLSVQGGTLNTNTIGSSSSKIGGIYSQNISSSSTSVYNTTVNTDSIYAAAINIINGTLNLGENASSSILSGDVTTIAGGTLNLYNTVFKASQIAPSTGASLSINNSTMNFFGINNYIGLYDTSKYIYSASIGDNTTNTINIGDDDENSDILNIHAGAGNFNFGSSSTVNINSDGELKLTAQKGNITFDSQSNITNQGTITINAPGTTNKVVSLGNINSENNNNGDIYVYGNATITGNVYTDKLTQTLGKTEIAENALLNAGNTGTAINISNGALNFNGNKAVVSVDNGTFQIDNTGEINILSGTESYLSAKTISITDTDLNLSKNTEFTFKPGTGNLSFDNVTTNLGESSNLTIDTTNGTASLEDSSITLGTSAKLNLQGNTELTKTTTTLTNNSELNLNSKNGDISLDADSTITNNGGNIVVNGDVNKVIINSAINTSNNKKGNIEKSGKNTLDINNTVYGNNLTVNEGVLNANNNIILGGTVSIIGDTENSKTAKVEIAKNYKIAADGDVSIGSVDNYANSILTLNANSTISGKNVYINAIVNAVKATIAADTSEGTVNIAGSSDITISHYSGDEDNITITTIKGKNINVSGKSNIKVEEGAQLVYDGTVNSYNSHYDVDKNAKWIVNSGSYTNEDGTVLYNKGNVQLDDNVIFINSSSTTEGSAIYNVGNIKAYQYETGRYAYKTQFSGNRTEKNGAAIYNGIAADNTNGIILLGDNAQFLSNTSLENGGAIYNISNGNTTEDAITIGDSSTFSSNTSLLDAGAIYASGAGKISIGKNSIFSSNKAGFNSSNIATKNANGGAVYIDNNATVSIGNNASFTGNIATVAGGAVYNTGTLIFNAADSEVSNYKAAFVGNGQYVAEDITNTTQKGGAIYNTATIQTIDETNNTYNGLYKILFGGTTSAAGNNAEYGGALYNAADNTLNISKSLFQYNKATKDGAAIYNQSGTIAIEPDTYFYLNEGKGNGGAIYNNANIQIAAGSSFGNTNLGNTANKGGAIYNNSSLTINADEDSKVNFIGNTAKTSGGAIYNAGTINLTNSNIIDYTDFSYNTAGSTSSLISGAGGAIYNEGTIEIENSNFTNNGVVYGSSKGGAIYNAGTLSIGDKAVFKENQATGTQTTQDLYAAGGAIYNAGILNINNGSTIQNNYTDGKGGAIYNASTATTIINEGAVIGGLLEEYQTETSTTGGNSALKGGGIYNDNGTLTFAAGDVYLIGNIAKEAGGAWYNKSTSDVSTENNSLIFYGNSVLTNSSDVTGKGGAIYNDKDSTGLFTVKNATFISNAADAGSAIYNAGNMLVYGVSSNYFEGNLNGSAIGNEKTMELEPGFEFGYEKDSIVHNAGALWNQEDGVITAKVSDDTNKSLYIHDTGYTDSNGNGAVNGAGLHLQDDSVINTVDADNITLTNTITNAEFVNNIGNKGGAVYKNSTQDLSIKDTLFDSNRASAQTVDNENNAGGGAIYNIGQNGSTSNITIDNDVLFKSNITSGKGGAIYNGANGYIEFAPGYMMGENVSGYSNVAGTAGGAIANEGTILFSTDSDTNRSVYFRYQGGGYGSSSGNVYNGKGGALYIAEKGIISTVNGSSVEANTLSKAVFTNNESQYGGAIYKDDGRYVLNIANTQFSGNRGYLDGGAVYNNVGEMNIDLSVANDNIFVGNLAGNSFSSISSSGRGGAIYNSGIMNITNKIYDKNHSFTSAVFVSNVANGADGKGGAIYNSGDITINGGVGFYNNSAASGGAIASSGSVTLNLEDENGDEADIIFSQNTATEGSAIYLEGGSLIIQGKGTVTFNDEDKAKGIVAQTIASSGSNAMRITGGTVNFYSDASGYNGTYYQTGGTVRSKNKFLTIADSPIRTVTGGTLILDEGAQLMSDYLLVSNIETESENSAKIIFNSNTKAKLTDLSALYDNASTFNYFKYTNTDDNSEHKVGLRAADVEINDTAVIEKDATIGNAKNSYMVRNLTLSKGAQLDANITVYGGTTSEDTGASLVLNEGALGSDKAGVSLEGHNSNLEINNTKTEIKFGGTIKNAGVAYNNKITKTGNGKVTISGDASGYNGAYSQNAGLVEFVKGSKFFGSGTTTNVTGTGELKIASDVELSDGSVINIDGNSTFSTAKASQVDLTGDSGAIITMEDTDVTINMGQKTALEVTSNAKVNAAQDVIRIGNDNLQVNTVTLGGSDQDGGSVNVTVNPNTKFILQNDSSTEGKGGILGFGENVTFKSTSGSSVTPTVQLKDNTQLKFNNENDSNISLVIQSIDDNEKLNTEWSKDNGKIIKENSGIITVNGAAGDFHGTLVVKDGGIDTSNTTFSADTVYDLSKIASNADVTVTNVTSNDDIVIVGGVSPEQEGSSYTVSIKNDTGNVNIKDANNQSNGDIYITNASTGTITTKGSTTAKNVYVKDSSVLNVSNSDGLYVEDDLTLKNSTINLLKGNLFIGGNYSMGSTVNMMNGVINTQTIAGNMTLTDNSDYLIDINPMLYQSDKVIIDGNLSSDVSGTERQLNISNYNLMSEPTNEYSIYKVFDVKGKISDVKFTTTKTNVTTPVANYVFMPSGNNGSYMLARTGFTPTAMAGAAAMQVGGYLSQLQTYDEAFGNLDSVMVLPVIGYNSPNIYANTGIDETLVYTPLFIPELEKGVWFRPYGNFESVDLQDGPKVTNQTYGALVGGDTALKDLGNGFQGTLGGYVGYTGAHQSFNGVSGNQNGGLIGVTGALYKGGFFSGLTVNANAGFSNMSTPYGKNDFFMLSAGVASKTGYNWELGRGRFIIQPSWLMSYTFVNAFNPSDIMGRKVDADALHGVQIAPGIKLMANLPQGWQPYLLCDFRFNFGDETHFSIGNVTIDDTYVKPYVEYGLGMQKRWGERFTGFGQFLARNGGRNGVGVNLGLRWCVGQGR